MDARLLSMLEMLALNVRVINTEIERLIRTEQFTLAPACLEMIDTLRGLHLQSLENLHRAERRMHAKR